MSDFKFLHIPCGPFANESEKNALERLRSKLQGFAKEGCWIFLTNIPFSFYAQGYSDEIDLLVISPNGVTVIEVKHWDAAFLRDSRIIVESEAEKLNGKVKRVASKLRQSFDVGFIQGRLLMTKGDSKLYSSSNPKKFRGITCYSLADWKEILNLEEAYRFDDRVITSICRELEPKTKVALSGDIRTFAGLANLELISNKEERFHRVYKGKHLTRRDSVILHLFDLSALTEKNAEAKARREFDTIQSLQKSPYLPRILDSFQYAPEYPGELCFYSIIDPAAPSIEDKAFDKQWPLDQRLKAAANCARALDSLHHPADLLDPAIIHRNLTPKNIRILSDNRPIFTELHVVKLPESVTVSPSTQAMLQSDPYIAPELKTGGIGVADIRSDVYSLCQSLELLFKDDTPLAFEAVELLKGGVVELPENRVSLELLANSFDALLEKCNPVSEEQPEIVSIRYWDEDRVISFQHSFYKIANKLGSGGIGHTFKVIQVDRDSLHEFGLYVAKAILDREEAEHALTAYRKARPHSTNPHLSVIHEIAPEWSPDTFVALMKWVPGMPILDLTGVVSLHAEDLGEESFEALVLRWLEHLCDALSSLHRANLVHGDVTPKNIIVSGGNVTLTDYDAVIEAGAKSRIDSAPYSSPTVQQLKAIYPSDDIYALATTFFHVLFDREPFRFGAEFDKKRGLNWEGLDLADMPLIVQFLRKATDPDPRRRFSDGGEAKNFIRSLLVRNYGKLHEQPLPYDKEVSKKVTPNTVPRLLDILLSYPGSLKGNRETRGLDTQFAEQTYVETMLDRSLCEEITGRRVNLVMLFGNAGDGKTAFLQHLAIKLGLPKHHSAERIWDHTLPNGIRIKANLDGSAAYQGRSATELLNEFFKPFHDCTPPGNLVHLIAINSGPLLKWIEDHETDYCETRLTRQLRAALEDDLSQLDNRFRLIDLNNRSLVGGVTEEMHQFSTDFIDSLIKKYLGENTPDLWQPCETCSAASRCSAWESVQVLSNIEKSTILRSRFIEALQAVHQRGEVHITARELRAAVSYIFFGLYYCEDLHAHPELNTGHYYERAFDPLSPGRQGELLKEFVYLDPSLEAHPKIDRYLMGFGENLGAKAPQYPGISLKSARRRAYFEWNPQFISNITGDDSYFGLARGKHHAKFRNLHLMDEAERNTLKRDICVGIARLEDLPSLAFDTHGIPLKIIPRTPTESFLWVKKPFSKFSLSAVLPPLTKGIEALHTNLELTYCYKDGNEERLLMNAELFHILLELKDGVQLSDAASEDIFANLAIFTQRLAQEDSRELYAWNPIEDKKIYNLRVKTVADKQIIACEPLERDNYDE